MVGLIVVALRLDRGAKTLGTSLSRAVSVARSSRAMTKMGSA
jgi:hypothetical protein